MACHFDSRVLVAVLLVSIVGQLTDSQGILGALRPTTTTPRPSVIGTIQNTVGNSLQNLPSSLQNIVMPIAQTFGLVTPPPTPSPWYTQVIGRIYGLTRYPLTVLCNGTLVQFVPTHIGTLPNVLHPATILQMMDSVVSTTTTRRPSILSSIGISRRTTQPPSRDLVHEKSPLVTTARPQRTKPQTRPHPWRASETRVTPRPGLTSEQKLPVMTTTESVAATTTSTSNASVAVSYTEEPVILAISEVGHVDEVPNGISSVPLASAAVTGEPPAHTRSHRATENTISAYMDYGRTHANPIDDGMKELDRLSRALQEPMLDDAQIRAMVHVDKIPMAEALKDLSAVIKLMTVEHQLTLQSLKIVSVALEKLAKRVHLADHPEEVYASESSEEGEASEIVSEDHHDLVRRSVIDRFRWNTGPAEDRPQADGLLTPPELSALSQDTSASSLLASATSSSDEGPSSDTPRSRQKRFLFGLGLWGLYSPWLWGGYWGGYGYGYGYGYYGGYYPYSYYPYSYYPYGYYPYYYVPATQTPAAPAALRKAVKKGNKK